MSCHTGAYPLRPSLLASLSRLSFGFGTFDQVIHHLVCLNFQVGTAPISIGHSSCQFELGRTYIDRSFSYPFEFLSWSRTYIDRPYPYHFCVQFESGSHLYRSTIILFVSKKDIPNSGLTNGLILENVSIVFTLYDGYIWKFPS